MSEVFSFRLNPNNPREASALEVIRSRQEDGYSIRQIMVEALYKVDQEANSPFGEQIDQVNEKLDELVELLRSGKQNLPGYRAEKGSQGDSPQDLSNRFLGAVKIAVKPGLRND